MNPVTSEVCDLLKLMPDSQVDEILEFVRTLREIRAQQRRIVHLPWPDCPRSDPHERWECGRQRSDEA